MSTRDQTHNILTKVTINPAAIKTTQTASSSNSVDTQGYEGATFIVPLGTWTDGTFAFALYESSDNTTFTAVAAGDLIEGNPANVTDNTLAGTALHVGYKGGKRYLSLQVTVTASPATGMVFGVCCVLGFPHHGPTF